MLKQDVLGAEPSLVLGERYECDIISLRGDMVDTSSRLFVSRWCLLHVPEIHNDTFAPTQISQNTAKLP